jgi:hypothetical protein
LSCTRPRPIAQERGGDDTQHPIGRPSAPAAAAVREHLAHGPLGGVYEIPLDVNDRIKGSENPLAALTEVLDAIDAQRAQ